MRQFPERKFPLDTRATVRVRKDEPQHTVGHLKCPACSEANFLLTDIEADISELPFREAAEVWMRLRKTSRLKPRTHEATQGYVEALDRFFQGIPLNMITPGQLRCYQIARAANKHLIDSSEVNPWSRPAGNSLINHELCALSLLLKHCRLWGKIRPYYFPLAVATWSPRDVLTEEDESKLFTEAAKHPEAALAYWVACITNNTTAAGCELRGLRIKHLFLRQGKEISEVYIPPDAVKNNSRPRKIALNGTAKWAIDQCYRRALSLGSFDPEHYLFPFCEKRNLYDPTRPAGRSFLRKSWAKLRAATGLEHLSPHDLRHQCITRMLENGVQPETVRAIAGHVTEQMMQYYSHIRRETKYAAVMAIDLDCNSQAKRDGAWKRRA